MEFVIGGLAATSAGFFTNPLEVVKHHMELSKKTQVTDQAKYKQFLKTGFKVARNSGLKSLQKGLSPALGAHLASYGMKLGTYQFGQNRGFTTNPNGEVVIPKSVLTSSVGGILGQYMSSPFYLIKTQHEINTVQDANNEVKSEGYMNTIKNIYREHGLRGFFRGATASMPRAFIGTSQLTSFAVTKESLNKYETFQKNPMLSTLLASAVAGVVLSMAMTPFEMVLTKMYKQAISGNQKVYSGFLDCTKKTFQASGFKPFYRGMGPIYLKLGPHTILCLVFWEEFKDMYDTHAKSTPKFYQNQFGFASKTEDVLGQTYEEELSLDYVDRHEKRQLYWN